jgi:hypothetical protein
MPPLEEFDRAKSENAMQKNAAKQFHCRRVTA